ncbi:MAG: alpha/beta fold hydrolase [Acidobacteriota bacterium]
MIRLVLVVLVLCLGCGDVDSTSQVAAPQVTADAAATDGLLTPLSTEAVAYELFEETMTLEDGSSLTYDRGVVTVPVRRDVGAESGTLDVEFYRFRRAAEARPGTPPIVILHGGPGFEGLGPRLEQPGYYENRLAPRTRIADVIVPGQRGFGSSTATPCEPTETMTIEQAMDDEALAAVVTKATTACRAKWEAEGFDLTGLNVIEAAADVATIAGVLGYEEIQLWGVSFGSHWAMTLIRQYPALIARATLGGLEGPDHTYDMPTDVLAALERIAASAQASAEWAPHVPEGGWIAAYRELIARAEREPIQVDIESPIDGEPMTVTLEADHLRQLFSGTKRYTGFRFRTDAWPRLLHELVNGELSDETAGWIGNRLDTGLVDAAFFQLDCASGLSEERGERLRTDPAADVLGATWLGYDTACPAWDADLGEAFRGSFRTAVPTVLVHGNWDTSTPYENAIELRPFFTDHRFVHVEGGSHGALREAMEDVEGFAEAMSEWLGGGDFSALPERVELPPLDWSMAES